VGYSGSNRWKCQPELLILHWAGSGAVDGSWGSYEWANGLLARGDGLVWACAEYLDGIHPNTLGREKVSNLMLNFFKTDDTTRPWYLDPPS